jgi:hypothetical protein
MSLSTTHFNSERSPVTRETPLLSEEGKKFLAGNMGAEEYIRRGRLRVEQQAVREVNEHLRFRSTRRFRTWLCLVAFLAYASLAAQSFYQSNDLTAAVLALVTALFAGVIAGTMFTEMRLWRARAARRSAMGSNDDDDPADVHGVD